MAHPTFASQLAHYRKRAGLGQKELAAMLSVTPQAVSKWENGSFPDSTLLPEIARILDVSLDVLFGIREEEPEPDHILEIMKQSCTLDDAERSRLAFETFYRFICTYDRNLDPEKTVFPTNFKPDTFAQLRTDDCIGLLRVDQNAQFFTFLNLPPEGVQDYATPNDRVRALFRLLSDEDALKLITFSEGVPRNYILTNGSLARHLGLPEERVAEIVQQCLALGIIWKLRADIGGEVHDIYSYVHAVPVTTILVLAKALTSFISNCEPNIDTWNQGAFRSKDNAFAYKEEENT